MRNWKTILAVMVLTAMTAWLVNAFVLEPIKLDSAKEGALAVLKEQEAAWNRADLPGFLKGYEMNEEITFYSDDNVAQGWVGLNDRFTRKYASNPKLMGHLEFKDLAVEPMNSQAVIIRGRWVLTEISEPTGGLFTILVKKTAAGWRVVHDHTSAKAKPVNQ